MITFAIFFTIYLLYYKDFQQALELGFWVSSSILMVNLIGNFFESMKNKKGIKRHQEFKNTKLYKELRINDYKEELINKYQGLLTLKEGRSIRVYYHWFKDSKNLFSKGDIKIEIFFSPLVRSEKKSDLASIVYDEEKLQKLHKKYGGSYFKNSNISFSIDRISLSLHYLSSTTYKSIQKEINKSIDVLKNENLKPLNIEDNSENYLFIKKQNGHYPLLAWTLEK